MYVALVDLPNSPSAIGHNWKSENHGAIKGSRPRLFSLLRLLFLSFLFPLLQIILDFAVFWQFM